VKFGATVSVVDEDTEEEARYQIVGDHEADVKSGRISLSSPLSRAMIGKEVGEVVEVYTPGGVKAYEILKVEWV
jgi:transcription elongation factor GreA